MVESLEVTITSEVTSLFLEVTVNSSSDEEMVEAIKQIILQTICNSMVFWAEVNQLILFQFWHQERNTFNLNSMQLII